MRNKRDQGRLKSYALFGLGLLITTIIMPTECAAEQKYNAWTGEWETVPDGSWETQYNPWNGSWSYQPKNASVEYNAWEGTWDWNSGHGNDNKNVDNHFGW